MSIRDQLLRHEGLRLKPYRDSVGKLTIGVGRNLDDVGISHEEALFLLDNDISQARARVLHVLPWAAHLDTSRFEVLINMAFNMGITGLLGFPKFLGALESGDFPTASREMLDSEWAAQVGQRAQELAQIMRTGMDPFANGKFVSGGPTG